ncbi:GAF and ANTAR domain-containing protein [Actinokineospora auranticolor]|uniref:GAF domain-containing protein n=1 Tax=Actinokineospora auranticolor TaxID=155976 RepID=A0A2S6GNR8_9PSEU|nr:GAF and ANTAR domain-containing protein [Actinokineospora auranticolor]PPK66826.1 GAF domain-containing protein [Actinokineospora auranticolor]
MVSRARLADVLIDLSDTLAPDFRLSGYLRSLAAHCARFAGADAVGVVLAEGDGSLRALDARPGERVFADLFDLQCAQGPAVLCCATSVDVAGAVDAWAGFGVAAEEAGFRYAHAVPMRLRGVATGAVVLYRVADEPFDEEEIAAVRALAHMAAVGIGTERAVRQRQVLADQLQSALDSRVVIEQAKGVLAERKGIRLTESFQELRRLARNHNLKIGQVAEEVVRSALPTPVAARG